MKFLYFLILTSLCVSCSMDNKAYPLQLEKIIKQDSIYQLTVSTEVDLNAIKNKHQFSEERFICNIKTRDFRAQNLQFDGKFSTSSQKEVDGKYYYTVHLKMIENQKNVPLTKNDTLTGYLQLSYKSGRTYPTKNVTIPAEKIIELN